MTLIIKSMLIYSDNLAISHLQRPKIQPKFSLRHSHKRPPLITGSIQRTPFELTFKRAVM